MFAPDPNVSLPKFKPRRSREAKRWVREELLRIAFLTDIHGNKEALQAVLRAVRADGFDELVFLGDLVGYGPDPADTVETVGGLVDQGALCIKGNHDEAAIIGGGGIRENAKIAIEWTQ